MKNTITKMVATASFMFASVLSGMAQSNLGSDCGCPTPVSSRPTVLMSTLATSGGAADGELLATNTILDCAHTWILDKKIYVPSGKTLTIAAGTVIKGRAAALATNATALTVERGGKIFASGSPTCQIVFTAEADNLDGTYAISNKGQWGSLLLAGKATNNLTLAANGPFQAGVGDGRLCVADGLGTFEGFASTNSKDQFGANLTAGETFDDNDNSGILKYVSIRHSGAVLQVGGEINGLTLGSVGRGTTIEHIEVISCADDAMEFFGGTVNVKYFATLFGNDDMFDWDDGYSGKSQFIFGIKSSTNDTINTSPDADNGFEMDADDQKSNLLPRSHPSIYNVTMIGSGKKVLTSDNSGIAAIEAKELTEGEIYNSVFANFRYGFNVIKALGTRTGTSEAYHNWAATGGNGSNSLKVKCNTFVGMDKDIAIDKNAAGTLLSSDTAQFYTTDLNTHANTIPGFTYVWSMNSANNTVATQYDATPNPALSTTGCPTAPVDGFYSVAPYRGAFASTGKNWLSDWTYAQLLSVTPGLQPCPTDINADGVTNNVDFLILLGQFNQSCH
ncbi:MAG: hypothetical protein IPP51_08370 [Bacteroidetes bacterium]|nr:hypothetical protein [Bacteroidota bacterium]